MIQFPENFLWGAAASAPQTEGHSLSNGKSPSTWDQWFSMCPEKFNQGQGPETTSNVYEMYRQDIERMATLGLNSYRTSIAWTRLLPDGQTINQEAVSFYRDYFQTLKRYGIEPIINLFHFDMPWWLMKKGGWETRISVDAFSTYAATAFQLFGDLVKKWTTFNEPIVHIESGYLQGYHFPAIVDMQKAVQVGYHTLIAHFRAVEKFRAAGINGEIGIILNISPAYARSKSPSDLEAKKLADLISSKSFLDPCVLGEIPQELKEYLNRAGLSPVTQKGDQKLIRENPVDFLGINYYQPMRVKSPECPNFPPTTLSDIFESYDWPERRVNPYRGWEIYPAGIYDVAKMIKEDYRNIPWYIAENGMGVADEERFADEAGVIQDDYRIDFMREHLLQLHKGISEGSNCFGYHTWTFVDCWSWLNGYRNRYGFYKVDLMRDYQRTIKKSGLWFKDMIRNRGF